MPSQLLISERGRSARASHLGFTLLEMLIVLSVLGILIAAGITTFAQQSRTALVRQAAIQVQSDLERLRSGSIKYNSPLRMGWSATFKDRYSVEIPNPDVNGVVLSENRFLPVGTELDIPPTPPDPPPAPPPAPPPTSSQVFYNSPLAQVTATDRVYRVSLPSDPGVNPLYVKVIGVTGRVMISATY